MQSLRQAVGLRGLGGLQAAAKSEKKLVKATVASFKQYREADGKFYFKLVDAQATVLLQSRGFESPKEAGTAIAQIKAEGTDALVKLAHQLDPVSSKDLILMNDILQQMV
jgi:tryptophanyl-tRNA synthetase